MGKQWQSCEKVIAFGDGDYLFRLPLKWLAELEAKCDASIGTIYARVMTFQYKSTDVAEVIRCGLIGGGMDPAKARRLIETYVDGFPLEEAHALAMSILAGCIHGYAEEEEATPGKDEAAGMDESTSRQPTETEQSSTSDPKMSTT